MFEALAELCAKCYALVFKSELSRQVHITHHITALLQTSKSKNTASLKKVRVISWSKEPRNQGNKFLSSHT